MAVVSNFVRRMNRLLPVLRSGTRVMSDSSSLPGVPSSTFISGAMSYQSNISKDGDRRGQTSNIVDVDGRKIHCEETGSGKHHVLLMPGALGSSITDFMPQLRNFNKDMFSLIAWDPPGYGKSYPPSREWVDNFLHEDAKIAARLMEVLDITKYSLLGWSDGGITAMILAAAHPEHVKKLVIWGANSYLTKDERDMLRKIQNIDQWSEKMKKPYLDVYGEEYFRKAWAQWVDAFIKSYFDSADGDICKGILSKITCPSLIIHGGKDVIVPQLHPDFLHKQILGSRLVNMPDGKHNLHLQFYKEFNSIVENFLLEQ
ncbi:hypothetical protein LSH36_326g04055 [Paralvinella palmiformis]|uniref:AB hydrolase-1 domain-containing protein n=1 Tax=Paralvinella palmiformis TaxID=53620 RepID=A0AAD9JHH3_9ANNE|nr:hypothetical protein LSH36_326g04055 [Paralvinella palmiformis]